MIKVLKLYLNYFWLLVKGPDKQYMPGDTYLPPNFDVTRDERIEWLLELEKLKKEINSL
jgi:hypothetical protein